MSIPTFTVYVGPMFSCKTTKLQLMLETFKYQRKKSITFKPKIDDRYSTSHIVSHGGWKTEAKIIEHGKDIMRYDVDKYDVIAVDEAFMIPGIADVLIDIYRRGYHVIVSSLDMSAKGVPFEEIYKIMMWATSIEKCAAVCAVCGGNAHYSYLKIEDKIDEGQIKIGGADMYEPRCFIHHKDIISN